LSIVFTEAPITLASSKIEIPAASASVANVWRSLRPVLFRLHDRRLPLPRQILKAGGLEQRLVKLTPLQIAHLREWRVADDLLDAAAQLRARH
jgi:hypothetical protein